MTRSYEVAPRSEGFKIRCQCPAELTFTRSEKGALEVSHPLPMCSFYWHSSGGAVELSEELRALVWSPDDALRFDQWNFDEGVRHGGTKT